MDDYPIHQTAEPIAHVASSDRNFYDRYYFNLHGSTDELFMVIGMGQYPNLATQDAFACVFTDATEHPLAFDLTWTGAIPAFEEPQHFIRPHGPVMFDSHRFAQTGF